MMNNDNIDIRQLLDRFYSGLTNKKEENMLREYFSGDSVDPDLRHEREMFLALEAASIPADLESSLGHTFDTIAESERTERRSRNRIRLVVARFTAVAACAALVIGLMIPHSSPSGSDSDTLGDMTPEEVGAHTEMALALISRTLNSGLRTATRATEITAQTISQTTTDTSI